MAESEMPSFKLRRQGKERDALPFDVDGTVFHFFPDRVNGLVLMDVTSMEVSQDSRPMWEFFEMGLGDDYPAFRAHVRSPDIDIEADGLRNLIGWMMETATERPPTPPASARGGRQRMSPGSTAT